MLNNDTVYFFQSNEAQFAFDYFPVMGCIVEKNGSIVHVASAKKSISLGFSKEETAEKWFSILLSRAGEVSVIAKPKSLEKNLFKFSFLIGNMRVDLFSAEKIIHYKVNLKQQQFEFTYNRFEQIFAIQTFMIEAENGESQPLLICGGQEQNERIMIKLCSKSSKNFKGKDVEIIANLSHFNIFCDHSTLKHLIYFAKSLEHKSSISSSSPQKDITVEFEYDIVDFRINFSKLYTQKGEFSFNSLIGKLTYKDEGLLLKGFLEY